MNLPFQTAHEFYWRKTIQEKPWRSSQFLTFACFSGMHLLGLAWLHKAHPSIIWPFVAADFLLLAGCWVRANSVRSEAAARLAEATSGLEEKAIVSTTYRAYRVCFLTVSVTATLFLLAQAWSG